MNAFYLSPGVAIVVILAALASCFPKDAYLAAEGLLLLIQVEVMNVRLYIAQRKMHSQLCKDAKVMGWPAPLFKFVRIQDRGKG